MNGNLQNGGLIHRSGDSLLVTDIKGYSGTYLIHNDTSFDIVTDSLMWFMNSSEGTGILYSDQRRGNRLFRSAPDVREGKLLLDKPCAQPLLHGDMVYYIDEQDGCLYCCAADGRFDRRLVEEKVNGFLLLEDETVIFASGQGIRMTGADGRKAETLSPESAGRMVRVGGRLAYADRSSGLILKLLDLTSGKSTVVEGIAAASLNTDGHYLYCANRRNGSSLSRVDPQSGSSIRISGESADYLHVLDGEIYFSHHREWYRLPLAGGEATKLPLTGGMEHEY
ncbi:hypothetical protein PAECIP111892_02962 [Paenibacillus auburnensis]|uniref:Prolow-density lipoprotein receptor-related protein 1-like beta-propeller domain-containing protein n=1 Tax=Paenibacillus auburnensis TaxID=2905649 RepID=A0ABN8GKI7_9BACL|nr:DUF5050 domain-containing protein [Paenibacillus auburnensis]CAH1207674.1 hypothetical protein PAECIP111892_02962 [Paenibacillus auburnensis]